MDCSPPGSSVHGISQAEYWSRLSFPSPEDLPDPGTEPALHVFPASMGRFFTTAPPGKPLNTSFFCCSPAGLLLPKATVFASKEASVGHAGPSATSPPACSLPESAPDLHFSVLLPLHEAYSLHKDRSLQPGSSVGAICIFKSFTLSP